MNVATSASSAMRFVNDFNRRLKLNPKIGEAQRNGFPNLYFVLPVLNDGHGEYMQAGRGGVSSCVHCGKVYQHRICHEIHNHEGVVYGGEDFTGKSAVMNMVSSCHRALCPTCFLEFATREARSIAHRFEVASKRGFGEVEAVVVSPPKSLWNLPLNVLGKMATKILASLGFTGGCCIPHGRRIDRLLFGLGWSPHTHGLVLSPDGYKCRSCPYLQVTKRRSYCHKREWCDGFEQRVRRMYAENGWVVKIEAKRKTVMGSALYYLNHCTVRPSIFHKSHSVHWWGNCAYRNFSSGKPEVVVNCPVCAVRDVVSVMEKEAHWGKENVWPDVCARDFRKVFGVYSYDSKGFPNFPSVAGGDNG